MRAVHLIGCRVVDSEGTQVGTVHDLRLAAAPHTHGLSGYRLDALITGSGSTGNRLGDPGGEVTGPWPLPQVFARLRRTRYVVPWQEVAGIEGKLIRLRVPASGLACGRAGSRWPGLRPGAGAGGRDRAGGPRS